MKIDRRGFVKALLGAGAGLWVPEKTYFFLHGTQRDFFMNAHPKSNLSWDVWNADGSIRRGVIDVRILADILEQRSPHIHA